MPVMELGVTEVVARCGLKSAFPRGMAAPAKVVARSSCRRPAPCWHLSLRKPQNSDGRCPWNSTSVEGARRCVPPPPRFGGCWGLHVLCFHMHLPGPRKAPEATNESGSAIERHRVNTLERKPCSIGLRHQSSAVLGAAGACNV
jgi:hypothetical protein